MDSEAQENLARLKDGVEVWNEWHQKQLSSIPHFYSICACLMTADLSGMDLRGVNFDNTALWGANLRGANLSGASLCNADLRGTNCTGANFSNARLRGARGGYTELRGANFSGADLSHFGGLRGDLSHANFSNANFHWTFNGGTDLKGTNFTGAIFHRTGFDGCHLNETILANVDLRNTYGLERASHHGPSIIDEKTILKSKGKIPVEFLDGCGLSEEYIKAIPSLVVDLEPAVSCLIYYSDDDNELVRRLSSSIWESNMRCDLLVVDYKAQVQEQVPNLYDYDRIVLILSEQLDRTDWLEPIVQMALKNELKRKRPALYLVQPSDFAGKVETGWAAGLTLTRRGADFRKWKNRNNYQQAFETLMREMQAGIR